MSADVLRRASALMRERAEAATPAPWLAFHRRDAKDQAQVTDADDVILAWCPDCGTDADCDDADAEHIASWHPTVALAVADWLDRVVGDAEDGIFDQFEDALPIARAYLGADS